VIKEAPVLRSFAIVAFVAWVIRWVDCLFYSVSSNWFAEFGMQPRQTMPCPKLNESNLQGE
jgi:hypothetical protein